MQIPSCNVRCVLALLFESSIFCGPATASEPVVTVNLEKPTWGQSLQVTYNTAADGAKFRADDDLRLTVWAVYADGWHRHEAYAMRPVGSKFVGEIPLREPLCQIQIHLFNRFEIYDRENDLPHLLIYRPDGHPVRHAYASCIGDAEPEAARELFEKEMTLYPDNYYAHRTWWQSVRTHNRSQYESELVNDLRRIERAVVGNPLDYQFIQVSAYLDLHKEEQARIILLTMLQEAPQARFTWFAARLYRYKTFAQNITGVGPTAVDDAIVAAVRKHPTSPLARIGLRQYIHEEVFPSEVLRLIANAWLPDNPRHSLPHYALAIAAERDGRMQESYDAVRRAIDLTLTANQHFPQGFEASRQGYFLPAMYRLWAEAALALGKHGEALAAAKAAAGLSQGDSDGRAEELEGMIWSTLYDTYHAERAFIAAHLRQAGRGWDDLRRLYIRAHGSEQGFDAHYGTLLNEALEGKLFPAPDFSMTTMKGDSFKTEQLRGKVVVLNFWYTGCGPCLAEMPDLNRIVEAFKSSEDVLFFAVAHDRRDDLAIFLKKHQFSYRVVPDAKAIHDLFDVRAHPTHVIIDRKGRILWRGSGSMTFDELQPMVARALALTR